jgi:hypothetical protein
MAKGINTIEAMMTRKSIYVGAGSSLVLLNDILP